MPRIRSVHPGLFTDENFVALSDAAQIFLIGIWTEADDQGVFEWKPITLKMRLRAASMEPVEPLLEELRSFNWVQQYEVSGKQYGAVRNFRKFQRPKKPNRVHPILDEFRTYVGLSAPGSELDGVKRTTVPKKEELAPQMEDGGEDEGEGKQKGGDANATPATQVSPVKRDLGSSALAKASPKPSRATRLPADFEVPEGWIMSAGEARERHGMPPVNLPLEAERFVNHFASSSGKNAAKLDWRRAFVNWCTSDKTQGAPRGNGRAPPQGTNGLAGAVGSVVQKFRDEEDAKRRTTEN